MEEIKNIDECKNDETSSKCVDKIDNIISESLNNELIIKNTISIDKNKSKNETENQEITEKGGLISEKTYKVKASISNI